MSFQILGLLGPAGSGKDVVADWFYKKGFLKLAFSDPMKRYAKDLFNYDTEQLWGPSELRNLAHPADDTWWMEAVARWGKVTNRFINELFENTFSNGDIGRIDAYVSLMKWFSDLRMYTQKNCALLSPRVVLQTVGTEWGRHLNENLWANYALDRIVPTLRDGNGVWYSQMAGCGSRGSGTDVAAGVIIPDHRFLNEVLQTQRHGGFVIRLSRPGKPRTISPGLEGHASEHQQLELPIPVNYEVELPEGLDLVESRLERLWKDQPWASVASSP